MKNCLIIFAKEPQEGKVKTRLMKYLSCRGCQDLYKAFLKDTINLAKRLQCKDKILAFEAENKDPIYLNKIASGFKFYRQQGKDLGQKMHNAFEFAKSRKASRIVLIGSDSPTLPVDYIKEAFQKLEKNDLILGPSYDGGYYLIGLKNPCLALFKGIKWGSARVFQDTIKNSKNLKKKVFSLRKWYDVDDFNSLVYLERFLKRQKDKNLAKWTRKFLRI
jgi:hypothetical protein